ncbi:MAG: hypothetical protein L3J23_07100 [Flavobacteriaceae bacterium]|nr:hypothetical protein [Flavobacteriaceae bacterium]
MKINFYYIVFLLTSVFLNAQNDTIKKENKPFLDAVINRQIDAKFKFEELKIDEKSTDISYLLSSKSKNLGLSYNFDLNKYLDPNKKPIKETLLAEQPLDKDIVVIKHFNGKNTTKSKFKTSQNLGTIESNTEFVRIEYRDFGLIDGDRVKVYLNEKVIDANVHLDGLYYTIHIKLEKKGFNRIDIEAINEGLYGPNTAEFVIYDDKGNVISHKSWNLKSKQMATLGILKY